MKKLKGMMIVICLISFSANVFSNEAREHAMKAFFMMEESPFDDKVFEKGIQNIKKANEIDPEEEWVFVSASLAALLQGYKIGNMYSSKTFTEESIDKAYEFAEIAIGKGGKQSQTHAQMARVLIIKGNYKKAWMILNKAYKLDEKSFYAWFYRGVISRLMQDYERAEKNFIEAQNNISHKYQKKLVTRQRQYAAEAAGDHEKEEEMLLLNIADFPRNAYMYGNYANFLYRFQRYEEAVDFYVKAIAITPYGNAIKWHKKAKEKASSN